MGEWVTSGVVGTTNKNRSFAFADVLESPLQC